MAKTTCIGCCFLILLKKGVINVVLFYRKVLKVIFLWMIFNLNTRCMKSVFLQMTVKNMWHVAVAFKKIVDVFTVRNYTAM